MSPTRISPAKASLAAALALAFVSAPALAIKPFSADYQANYMGIAGAGKMTLESQGGDKWKYTLSIGSGGIQLNQSTVFEDKNGQWRPLSGKDSALLLIKKTDKTANYDWNKGVATWGGDVKPDRSGPVKLETGDVDSLLLNLALARDVAAGKPLNYRLVDEGRVKQISYKVAGKESITIDGQSKQATKVVQANTEGKQITAWIVDGMPVPARILQRKNGKDDIDLQVKTVH
ncbi:DUF3108 domain-containing protein [Luteimonas aquatica]|uniref:DUF3108 domain-containing protein n=1 Tax=Luteimonas aquatica TaxID=450364 RepID=UPI001F55F4E1|nr:DUF3108 domain-containing protein [Luteimonas aquatica]